jgi:DNA processing protein
LNSTDSPESFPIRATIELPAPLQRLSDPPSKIWWRGTLPKTVGVAVVGTRRCTSYGWRISRAIGRVITGAGWPVISGLARGVDAAAHHGTLDVGDQGFAVLGSGIDVVYPVANRTLAEGLLAAGGGILSEYPPGTPPAPFRFPARNRLIAALSGAVVVVEAGVTGGALITARIALELGIEVLAVPGDIDREVSAGTNLLIRDGAHPILGEVDLLQTLEMIMGPVAERHRDPPPVIDDVDLNETLRNSARPVSETLANLMKSQIEGSRRPTGH